jgi:hypothetical protein
MLLLLEILPLTVDQIEEAARQWRDAWTNILNHQLLSAECFYTIYKPLGAKSSEYGGRTAAETPPAALERCATLQEAFAELKTDMMEEVKDIEKKLVIPAKLARDAIKPMHKAIKKREDKKVGPDLLFLSSPLLLTDAVHRSTTSDTRADARPCRTRKPAQTETT